MKKIMTILIIAAAFSTAAFGQTKKSKMTKKQAGKPEYYSLRPELEKQYGYTHTICIGDDLKIFAATFRLE